MCQVLNCSTFEKDVQCSKDSSFISIGEIPEVHMQSKEIRQWRETILHRKKIVDKANLHRWSLLSHEIPASIIYGQT
jgi:hypothetical protein